MAGGSESPGQKFLQNPFIFVYFQKKLKKIKFILKKYIFKF
jgi:hypothetical protein